MVKNEAVLERLAREILMVDDHNRPLIPEYETIIGKGFPEPLPPSVERRDVLIIGAGMAGLMAGKVLKDAGYNVTILEANDNRIGGRVKTFHSTPDGVAPFKDPRQYAEAGAMRIPTTHPLVNKLIDVMGLRGLARPFFNVDVSKTDATKQRFRTWLKTNGVQVRNQAYNARDLPEELRTLGFPVGPEYREKTASALLSDALAPLNALIAPGQPIEKQVEGWKQVIAQYDAYSMFRFLSESYPETVVQYIGTLQNLTSRFFLSFIHSFVDTFYISPGTQYVELAGGNWQLPYAFLPYLQENIVMDARAIELQWSSPSQGLQGPKAIHNGRPGVYVRTLSEPIVKRGIAHSKPRIEREFTADYLLVTIPFSALRHVNVTPDFSYEKRRAIMELHYDSATKVLLEFSERFWEWNETEWKKNLGGEYRGHDSYGGGSVTDNPNRFLYFPSHPVEGSRGGVILASYTWSDDASRWDSIPAEDRYNFALKGLTDIYGPGIKRYFTGFGKTESWMENFYAFGEAAVFAPSQLTTLHPHIPGAEGLVHFAGEHTSLKHAWIEGALESAIRSAKEIHQRALKQSGL
ncbi:flavin monoamine oxidase family protein [Archangium violaceum]|uniref:flavin monoamine oxidase family protein n=1 Tax=Archangium violaceum TaxID=83451 RepID=UPI0005BC3B67|nr:FAD-dependent oxidoreductase [Archangium violaceum]